MTTSQRFWLLPPERHFLMIEKWKILNRAPKDRRFLVLQRCWAFRRGVHNLVGYRWAEAFWDGLEYRLWAGGEHLRTTEKIDPSDWAEIPSKSFFT